MKNNCATLVLLVFGAAAGCGTKGEPLSDRDSSATDGGDLPQTVVYSSNEVEMKPILDTYCLPCHSSAVTGTDRGGAPVGINYDTFEAAVQNAVAGNRAVQAGTMPPSGATPSDEEKRLFQLWVDTGLN